MGLVRALAGMTQRAAKSRDSLARAGDYGRVAVPGTLRLELRDGPVKLWYFEPRKVRSDGDRIDDIRPADLTVLVAPAAGGAPLEVRAPGWKGLGRQVETRAGRTVDLHGTVDVTVSGEYVVTVTATLKPGAVEPQLLLGP